jgi:hypothetical protein
MPALIGGAIAGSAALGAGSSLLGSGKASSAAKSAQGQSLQATYAGIANQQQMYGQTVGRLDPFVQGGQSAVPAMQYMAQQPSAGAPYLQQGANYLSQAAGMTPPSVMTEADLQNTPGYQFQLAQGLKATQAAAAARGLGVSGASLKGAATFATGLADSNYQNQFNNAQTAWQDVINQGAQSLQQGTLAQQMQQQQYNQYAGLGTLGENAAAGAGTAGTAAANATSTGLTAGAGQAGNYLTQAGQAQAAGTAGVGNAATSGVNSYLSYNALQGLMGNQNTFGGSQTGGFGNAIANSGSGGGFQGLGSGFLGLGNSSQAVQSAYGGY